MKKFMNQSLFNSVSTSGINSIGAAGNLATSVSGRGSLGIN